MLSSDGCFYIQMPGVSHKQYSKEGVQKEERPSSFEHSPLNLYSCF